MALALVKPAPAAIRRFQTPDLSKHGGWMLPRLCKAYPLISEGRIAGWLQGLIYSNEFLFLYQDHAVALAQRFFPDALQSIPVITEKFVFVENPEDPEQQASAALFYDEFHRWAKNQGILTIIVEELSDVPHDTIKERLGRLYTRQQTFARL
jgi:hypothetical protein